jgi:pimeloyl-ACP methyl ester carboxylesterase
MNRRILRRQASTGRHRTAWLEAGSADGPLMVFIHGWPELGLVWWEQLEHFASAGGGASHPTCVDMADPSCRQRWLPMLCGR